MQMLFRGEILAGGIRAKIICWHSEQQHLRLEIAWLLDLFFVDTLIFKSGLTSATCASVRINLD